MEGSKLMMLVPRLRFPEFRDAGEWENANFYDLLEDILDFRGRTPLKIGMEWGDGNIISLSANNVKNGYIDYSAECNLGSQDLYEKWMGKVCLEKNDIVFTMEAPLGNALLIPDSRKYILSQRVVAFKTKKEKINNFFFIQLIWGSQFQNSIHQLASGSTAKGINQKSLKKVNVEIPTVPEQRKIADCLSSIDDRLATEAQKLETLKAHKKGLMQQLFPPEGETLPQLRFPEFHNSGEWEEKTIVDFAKVTTGNKDTQNKVDNGLYPFFVRSQNVERINSFSYDGEAILTSGDGVGVGKNFHYINGKFDFHQRVYCIYDFKKYISGKFIYLYFCEHFHGRVMRLSAKNSVDSVRMSMITKMPIFLPSLPEQQKIADSLSYLDNLIALQTQKIETLKLHKKGLMQQLFPTINTPTP